MLVLLLVVMVGGAYVGALCREVFWATRTTKLSRLLH